VVVVASAEEVEPECLDAVHAVVIEDVAEDSFDRSGDPFVTLRAVHGRTLIPAETMRIGKVGYHKVLPRIAVERPKGRLVFHGLAVWIEERIRVSPVPRRLVVQVDML